jgi:serine/threonine protein phosphatase PrpC
MFKGQFACCITHITLTVALKDSVTSEPFFHQIALTPDDKWLIVACDGLWDVVSDAEAVAHIQGCQLASQACESHFQLSSFLPPASSL